MLPLHAVPLPEGTHSYIREQNFTHHISKVLYNDLLDRHSSGRGRDEVTYFYVRDVFYIPYLGTKYADFQEKIFTEISGKNA